MPATRPAVAANARAEIARSGLGRRVVAKSLGMSYQALSRRLQSEVPFTVDELATLATKLGVPLSSLLQDAA